MLRTQLLAIPDGGHYPDNPPDGPPRFPSTYFYGGEENPLLGVQWVNGDTTAWTQIGFEDQGGGEPTVHAFTIPPGATSYETGMSYGILSGTAVWVRHTRGGTPSDWVEAS